MKRDMYSLSNRYYCTDIYQSMNLKRTHQKDKRPQSQNVRLGH